MIYHTNKKKKTLEIKINKLNIAITKAEEYLEKLREIYGAKKTMQKKQSYIVEYNNSKEVLLSVEFNNQKDIPQNVIEQEEIRQEEIQAQENNEQNNIDVNNFVDNYNINQTDGTYNELNIDNYNTTDNNNNDIIIDATTDTNNNINYDEYQITNTTNTKVTEEIIGQSTNKEIITNSTLPTIYKQTIRQVIYDKDVKTLPVIYGGTKVTYENNNANIYTDNTTDNNANLYNIEGSNYLSQENTYEINEIKGTQVIKLPPETVNYTEYNQVQDYTNMNQAQSYNLENNVENYTNTNINQEIDYGLMQPLYGQSSYVEYKKTNY